MINKINDEGSYGKFWVPVDQEVRGKKKVYISLDGVYNQLTLYTLKKPGGDYLINQYDIILIGCAYLVTHAGRKNSDVGKNATLFGYPAYGSEKILIFLQQKRKSTISIKS